MGFMGVCKNAFLWLIVMSLGDQRFIVVDTFFCFASLSEKAFSPRRGLCFHARCKMQDGAPPHTSKVCQMFLREYPGKNLFAEGNEWPPYSPDCNVLDYYFWDAVSHQAYKGKREPFSSDAPLKERIRRVWRRSRRLPAICKAINQFRPRLRSVVLNNRAHINTKFM